ncbi:MAG TPA: NAD(P)-dependent oxidoreductase [Gemmatimonadales bacterium]|nr:NAD(P)-dependent oxidoreductase [Gemmatimonadales bacterium]
MNILLTGATGFVGGHVADRLVARGDHVTALVRTPARAARLADAGIALIPGDLDDHTALRRAAQGQDAVCHIAALTGAVDEAEFLHANRDGTVNLIRAVEETAPTARFVYISSMAAGGPARRGHPRIEGEPDTPVTMYGRSKLAGEVVTRASRLPWVILRPPTVYGPRDRENLLVLFQAARGGVVPVFGDGSMELSAIHVADLADAIVQSIDAPAITGRTFYVNHPEVVTSRALVTTIATVQGKRVRIVPLPEVVARAALGTIGGVAALLRRKTILRYDKANEFYQEAWTADPSAFRDATGWDPTFDLARGLADTFRWYREAQWL